jgi:3-hydroxyisobutyrate dehydrogenase-like beta-hydroxyacid dehydrogenase
MANVGFIGLGTMGGPMAQRLLDAGYTVTGYNRTQSRAQWLMDLGMRWAGSPRAVAEAADVTFTMLRDTQALEDVAAGPDGLVAGLGPGKIYVDMSTVSPDASRTLAGRVAETGAQMLDAPVSGSSVTLLAGRLSIMAGGDREVFEQVKPILQAIGPTVNYVGGNGLAVAMKVATNLSLPVQVLAFCESILLAEKSGIPRETAIEVLLNSVVASPALQYRIPLILDPPEGPLFDVNMMQKDLKLALEMGEALGVPLPTTALSNQWLTAARGWGVGDQDFVALYQVLSRLAGMREWGRSRRTTNGG